MTKTMSGIGVLAVIGLIVIVIVLLFWVFMTVRANRNPTVNEHPDENLKRGPVSGGVIRGDPGQNSLTGEAHEVKPRREENRGHGPLDL